MEYYDLNTFHNLCLYGTVLNHSLPIVNGQRYEGDFPAVLAEKINIGDILPVKHGDDVYSMIGAEVINKRIEFSVDSEPRYTIEIVFINLESEACDPNEWGEILNAI